MLKKRGAFALFLPYLLVVILFLGSMESTQLTDHISATLPSISVPPPTFSEEISEFSDQESNNEAFQKNSLDSTNTTTSNIFEVSNDFLNGSMNNLTLTQNDLLSLDRFFVEDWKDITTPGPSARSGHAMVYVPTANQIVLFGGIGYDIHPRGYIYEDTWVFDLETNNWTQMFPEVYPDARADHAMVYDPELDLIVLYGGINDNPDFGYDECFNDVWFYDLKTNYWDFGDLWGYSGKPSGRCGHSMVYDPFEGHLVVFGGWDPFTDTFSNDTWIFDCYFPFVECYEDTPYLGSSPSPRAYHSMVSVFDPDRPDERIIVLYGGKDATSVFDDTWYFSPSFWVSLNPPTSPSARFGHSMVYDPFQNQVLLFGGCAEDSEFADTWIYSSLNNNWTQLSLLIHPSGRGHHTMIFDPNSNNSILFGGCIDWDPYFYGRPQAFHATTWIFLGYSYYKTGLFRSNRTDFQHYFHISGNITWNPPVQPFNTSLQVQIGLSNTSNEEDFHLTNLSATSFIFTGFGRYLIYQVHFQANLIQNSTSLLEWINISYTLEKPLPIIRILTPQNGSLITGMVNVSVNTTSPNGIETVCFYVDNLLLVCFANPPYIFSWNCEISRQEAITLTVVALTVLGRENTKSVILILENPTFIPPGIPQNLSVSASESSIFLHWLPPVDEGSSPISEYRIYRGTSISQYTVIFLTADTSYYDTLISVGTTYYYVVTAVNSAGESFPSTEVSAIRLPPSSSTIVTTSTLSSPSISKETEPTTTEAESFPPLFIVLLFVLIFSFYKRKYRGL